VESFRLWCGFSGVGHERALPHEVASRLAAACPGDDGQVARVDRPHDEYAGDVHEEERSLSVLLDSAHVCQMRIGPRRQIRDGPRSKLELVERRSEGTSSSCGRLIRTVAQPYQKTGWAEIRFSRISKNCPLTRLMRVARARRVADCEQVIRIQQGAVNGVVESKPSEEIRASRTAQRALALPDHLRRHAVVQGHHRESLERLASGLPRGSGVVAPTPRSAASRCGNIRRKKHRLGTRACALPASPS
jgi:hypothetical protein